MIGRHFFRSVDLISGGFPLFTGVIDPEVMGNAEEVGGKLCGWFVSGGRFPEAEENFLKQVVHPGLVPAEPVEECGEGAPVQLIEFFESTGVSLADPQHKLDFPFRHDFCTVRFPFSACQSFCPAVSSTQLSR